MDRKTTGIRALALVLAALACPLALSATAHAAKPTELPERRSREVLALIDAPLTEPGWIVRHVAIDYTSGFHIRHTGSYRDHRFDLRLRGPVYETPLRRSNYGLILEVKF